MNRQAILSHLMDQIHRGRPAEQIAAIEAIGEIAEVETTRRLQELARIVEQPQVKHALAEAEKRIMERWSEDLDSGGIELVDELELLDEPDG